MVAGGRVAPTPTIVRVGAVDLELVADREALVEHRVVDDDLARRLGQAPGLELEEALGERVGQVDPGGREVDDPVAEPGPRQPVAIGTSRASAPSTARTSASASGSS